MKKLALVAAVFLAAPGCAAIKGWLANGPEIELSAGVGPASFSVTLNPGKTLADVATTVASAAESVVPVTEDAPAAEPAAK